MRRSLFIVSALVSSAFLTACGNPAAMPSGYTYHQKPYKAPPGIDADSIGYPYSYAHNEQVLNLWTMVVSDLLDQMEYQTGTVPQPVYLKPLPQQNPFNATYDHILRQELRKRGYTLQPVQRTHLQIHYEAIAANEPVNVVEEETPALAQLLEAFVPDQDDPVIRPDYFTFRLTVFAYDDPIEVVESSYRVPEYGYKRGEGRYFTLQKLEASTVPGGDEVHQFEEMPRTRPAGE